MNNPKEFWILEDDNLFLEVTRYSPDSSDYNAYRIIHVIEYSAYEQLQSKFKEAVEVIKFYADKSSYTQISPEFGYSIVKIKSEDYIEGWNDKIGYTTKTGGKRARDFLRSLDKGE